MPELRMPTMKLQEMVARVSKGAGNNKHLPLTSLMDISLREGKLVMTTTDGSNYLQVIEDKIIGENFSVVVQLELFSKLIAKTTVEQVTLTLDEEAKVLKVKGNGNYTIELPLNEESNLIVFPMYTFNLAMDLQTINLSSVKNILAFNKASIATSMENPQHTAYYCGEAVITTDSFKVCYNKFRLLAEDVLIPADLMNLLGVMNDEKISAKYDSSNGTFLFFTPSCTIFGRQAPGIGDFQVQAIEGLISMQVPSMCKVPKTALLSLLDRLMLFVSQYDKNSVTMTFTNQGMHVSSKKATGSEIIVYQESKDFADFTCIADIQMLRELVSAIDGDIVELWYGDENILKLVSGKVTQIMSLLEDEDSDGESSANEE